ncbi:hypothetical protein [Pseudoalteromonas sp. MQS005]|uniref:hypothetical protein n=1 Tax=Pseudoalteromonas sp. MQS005 TaxID=1854052 RepID=UPI0007E4E085|nr:hypothetical protein [Pseudoalteromonas sp. MQS005]
MKTLPKLLITLSGKNSKRNHKDQVNLSYQFLLATLFLSLGAATYLMVDSLSLAGAIKLMIPTLIAGYLLNVVVTVIKNGKEAKEEAIAFLGESESKL